MKYLHILILPAMLLGCATPQILTVPVIPSEFHGIWAVEKRTCLVEGLGHDGDITITATEISFHAEPYRVKTLVQRRLKLLVTYDPPEQTIMQPPEELYLSADKNKLSDLWHRCPKKTDK